MPQLYRLINQGLAFGHDHDVQLLVEHVTTADGVNPLADLLSDEILAALVKSRPKMIPELVSPANSTLRTAERVIRLPHNPTARIVNKIPMHRGALSDFAVDYVVTHGGKVALETLLERHAPELPGQLVLELQRTLFHRHKRLYFPCNSDPVLGEGSVNVRALIQQSLELLTEADDAHLQDRHYENVARSVQEAGFWVGEYELAEYPNGPIEAIRNDHAIAGPYLTLNYDLMKSIPNLTPADQLLLYESHPTWAVLNRIDDPHAAITNSSRRGLLPPPGEKHVPTYRVIRTLSLDEALRSEQSTQMLLRLMANTFGSNPSAWTALEGLYDDWQGTIGELIDTVTSLC